MFTRNAGTVDRVIRVVLGLVLLSLVVVGPRTLWGLIGLVPLLTGAMGNCPAYSLLGFKNLSAGAFRARRYRRGHPRSFPHCRTMLDAPVAGQ